MLIIGAMYAGLSIGLGEPLAGVVLGAVVALIGGLLLRATD